MVEEEFDPFSAFAATTTVSSPKASQAAPTKKGRDFYRMPMAWHVALEDENAGGKVWAIAGRLMHEDFKAKGQWFKFANVKLRGKIERRTKYRALELFARLGLIEVSRNADKKSPWIRLLIRP